jgi:hypothetical protein
MRSLWSPPPGSLVSAPRIAAVYPPALPSRKVLASKGSLRRTTSRRALAVWTLFCRSIHRDGRLRREAEILYSSCKTKTRLRVNKRHKESLDVEHDYADHFLSHA